MILEVAVAVLSVAVIATLLLVVVLSRRVWALEEKERALREWIDETDEWCNETTDVIDGLTARVIRLEFPAEPPTQVESFSTQLSRDPVSQQVKVEVGAMLTRSHLAARDSTEPGDIEAKVAQARASAAAKRAEKEAGAIVSAAFLLALGVLPDGWRKNERGSYELIRDGVVWGAVWVNRYTVWFAGDFWPEAVRSGQADIACRLLAAHVELERRRAGKGGEE